MDQSRIVLLTRIIRIVFGGLAGLMLLAALADILFNGHLTIIPPVAFGALLAVALAFLVQNLVVAREKSGIGGALILTNSGLAGYIAVNLLV